MGTKAAGQQVNKLMQNPLINRTKWIKYNKNSLARAHKTINTKPMATQYSGGIRAITELQVSTIMPRGKVLGSGAMHKMAP